MRLTRIGVTATALALTVQHASAEPLGPDMWGSVRADKRYGDWQVALMWASGTTSDALRCGGTLVAKNWVLTAAHCFVSEKTCAAEGDANTLEIAYGSIFLSSMKKRIKIDTIVSHPRYDCKSKRNDIALVRLQENIDGPKMNLPSVAGQTPPPNLFASGWGRKEDGLFSLDLRTSPIPTMDVHACKKVFAGHPDFPHGLPDATVCGGADGVHDACTGDSGGPLFQAAVNGEVTQFGVVSFGDGCGKKKVPGVFTEVSQFLAWIKDTRAECGVADVQANRC